MQCDVTVVIPIYNRIKTVCRAINSVLSQTVLPKYLICVDDGSNDRVSEIIYDHYISYCQYSHLTQIKIIRLDKNQGVSRARNEAINNTHTSWISFLDSDDMWLPTKLEKQWHFIQQYPHVEIIHCDEIWVRRGRRVNPMKKHRKTGGFIFERLLERCLISPSSVLIHMNLLKKDGLFNESLRVCEDYDLWLRICHDTYVHYLNEPLIIKYGGHTDQLSKKYDVMDMYRIKSIVHLLYQKNLSEENKKLTLQILRKKCNILSNGAFKRGNKRIYDEYNSLYEKIKIKLLNKN